VNTAKAVVIKEPRGPLVVEELKVPELVPGSVLVRVELAGICGSDFYVFEADDGQFFPRGIGHEMAGTIAQLGQGVGHDELGQRVSIGDRIVALAWIGCGSCYYCTILRRPTLCRGRYVFGKRCDQFPYITGTIAQFIYLPPGSTFLRLDSTVPLKTALLASCPLRTIFNACEALPGGFTGKSVVIQGAGSVGLMAVAVAHESGARNLIVIDEHEDRLSLAVEFGARQTLNTKDVATAQARARAVADATDQIGADFVFECSGAPEAIEEGIEMARSGGEYLLIGRPKRPSSVHMGNVVSKMLRITGIQSSDARHLASSVEFIQDTHPKYPYEKVVSQVFPLEEANEAFEAAKTGTAVKAAVAPWA
jgi:threonine dehydrogenase-like Zn-dependent dehydrogenase